MYEIYVLEREDYEAWRSQISYNEYDSRGYDGVSYLRCKDACDSLDAEIYTVMTSEDETISEVIRKAIGEVSKLYSLSEAEAQLNARQESLKRLQMYPFWGYRGDRSNDPTSEKRSIRQIVLEEISKELKSTPNLSLLKLERTEYGWNKRFFLPNETIKQSGIREGDVFLIKHTSLTEIVDSTIRDMIPPNPECAIILRNGDDFIKSLTTIDDQGKLQKIQREDIWSRSKSDRPSIVLLYTDEDPHVASYVRTHYDSLDKASGDYCDIFFIENPSSIDPYRYWRQTLEKRIYVAWKLLGWADTIPYNKNEVYKVASKLGVDFNQMPCAIEVNYQALTVQQVFPLSNDLTLTFRNILSHYQSRADSKTTSHSVRNRLRPRVGPADFEETKSETPICFLSHNSKDKNLVRQVASSLHSSGIETWFDEWEVFPGDKITERIEDGLSKATSVLVFLSQDSLASKWVKEEIHNALYQVISKGTLQIIPIVISECQIPLLLTNYKFVDVGKDASTIAYEVRRAVLRINDKPPVRK